MHHDFIEQHITSILSAENHEPSHSLNSPEGLRNLWPTNQVAEEIGGEPLLPFSMSLASSHDFNVWPENSLKHGEFGVPSEILHPQIAAEETPLREMFLSHKVGQVDATASGSTRYVFLLIPRRISPFSAVVILPLTFHQALRLIRSRCAEKLGCNNRLLGLLQKQQDRAKFVG